MKNMNYRGNTHKSVSRHTGGCLSKNTLFACSLSLGMMMAPQLLLAADVNAATDLQAAVTQQNRSVTGRVVDEKGEPLIGVSIQVKGTKLGTVTDFDGNFKLNAPADATLVISYVGFRTQEIELKGRSDCQVSMVPDDQLLDEVVVVGYGVVKKSDLTGSVGSVKSDVISARGSTSVMESLQGQVAGVNITQSSSRAGDGFSIQIRGKSSLNDGEPLYVIDGVVCDNMDFLNPMDIEKVDVLKDASSTAIYGSRATNGVLMITTKKGAPEESRATVSYDGYYGVKNTTNMPDFMDGDQFLNWRFYRYFESSMDSSTGLTTWNLTDANYQNFWGGGSEVVKDMYRNKRYTDWVDLVTRTGSQQNHFVNITGNARDISYRVGLGYQDEEGVLYDGYSRWNLKGAVDHKISDKVSAGFSTNMATSLKESGSNYAVLSGFRMTPTMPAYYWEGENAGELIVQPGKDAAIYPNGGGPTSNINPLVDRENSKDNTRSYDIMANLYLQYSPIKEVILKTTFSPMYTKSERGTFYNGNTQYRSGKTNMAEKYNDQVFSYTWDTQANFIKSFGDHNVNVLGLFSVYDQRMEGDVLGAAGHHMAAGQQRIGGQLAVPGHNALKAQGFAVVFLHLLGQVPVKHCVIGVGNLHHRRLQVEGQRILDVVVLHVPVRVIVGNGGTAGDRPDHLMNGLLIDVRGGAVEHHHFAVGQLIHHQLAHVGVVAEKSGGVGKQHFLIDAPVLGQIPVQSGEFPHPVVLDDNPVDPVLFADCGQVFAVDIALLLQLLQIDVPPPEAVGLQLVHSLLALQNQGLFPRIEAFVLHGLLNDMGLPPL